MTRQLNKYSSKITQPKSQGASQAMLYATGLTEDDMDKPQIGISSVWYEGNSCNMHLLQLAEKIKEGVMAVGLVGFRFNTIGVSDGINTGNVSVPMGVLLGDVNASGVVTSGDTNLCKAQALQAVTTANFRNDVNASGAGYREWIDKGNLTIW